MAGLALLVATGALALGAFNLFFMWITHNQREWRNRAVAQMAQVITDDHVRDARKEK